MELSFSLQVSDVNLLVKTLLDLVNTDSLAFKGTASSILTQPVVLFNTELQDV